MNKLMCTLALIAFASPALAEELAKVESLKTLELRENELKVSYLVGGGCREHTAKFHLSLTQDDKKKYVATLNVLDSTESPDTCDAIVEVSGSVNIQELLKKEAARQKIDPSKLGDVVIELPKATTSI